MQIKNNQTRNAQFFYYRQKEGSKAQELALVHIPGGATVYGYGFVQKNAMPKFSLDDILKIDASISILGTMTVYVED